jgi:uncharacterized membrane protein
MSFIRDALCKPFPLIWNAAGGVIGIASFFGIDNQVAITSRVLGAIALVLLFAMIGMVVIAPYASFLGVFVGTVALGAGCVVVSFFPWHPSRSPMLFAAALLYVVGSFLVTMVFNVPMNNRLARLDHASSEAAAYWPVYVREWSKWNHVRTVASLASAACSAASLAHQTF